MIGLFEESKRTVEQSLGQRQSISRYTVVDLPPIMDIEASGFGSQSYPVEVGVILQDGSRYCSLIKPFDHWQHWQKEAEALHGLTRQRLIQLGREPVDVCNELNHRLRGMTLYSDGWVVDQPWLVTLFSATRVKMAFHLSPLEMIMSEPQIAIWQEVKQSLLRQRGGQRHRASTDAELIQQTFRESQSKVNEKC